MFAAPVTASASSYELNKAAVLTKQKMADTTPSDISASLGGAPNSVVPEQPRAVWVANEIADMEGELLAGSVGEPGDTGVYRI